jgi:hypothetical protein
MQKKPTIWLLFTMVLLAGCASTRGISPSEGVYSQDVGPATIPAVQREVIPILERFGYTVRNTDRGNDRITIETDWVERDPYNEEAAAGVNSARSRVLVNTRPRATSNSAGVMLAGVTLRIEVQHLVQGGQAWAPARQESREMSAIATRIVDAIRLELQVKGMQGQ